MATTANLGTTKIVSENDANKVATINTAQDEMDSVVAGMLTLSVAGNSNVTLTRAQALNKVLKFTGALTGNISVLIPATGGAGRFFVAWNATSGAYTLTVKTTAGGSTGIAVTQDKIVTLFHDGTNVVGSLSDLAAVDSVAWASYSPTITTGAGTITALGTVVAKYKQIGTIVFVRLRIPITTNGTGAGYVKATLPVSALASTDFALHGSEPGITDKALSVSLISSLTALVIKFYDGTYPGANGAVLLVNGFYEAA